MNDTSWHAPRRLAVRREPLARPGRRAGPYPQRHRPAYRRRRGGRPGRPVGLGQVDPADGRGRAGAARHRHGPRRRAGSARARRGCAGALSRPPCRHRVPVVPPDPHHDGAGERRGAARARGRHGRLRARRAGAGLGRICASASITIRPSFRAASSSASRSRARSRRIRRSSSPTSRPAISTRPPAARSSNYCSPAMRNAAPR